MRKNPLYRRRGSRPQGESRIPNRKKVVSPLFHEKTPFPVEMQALTVLAQLLVLIGALNWGLIGFTKTDAVAAIFPKAIVPYVYSAVGLAALYLVILRFL